MIGEIISHYRILEKLGQGGMGVVYKARDTKLDREVAIKFLPPHLSADTEATKRFIHEAKAASAIDHSHIGTIHEIDESEDGQTFIVMALYEGGTLREGIDSGCLTTEEAVTIASQITSGLARAHEKGIVHRDIKPQNILLTRDGEAKIIDFGLAKLAGRTRLTRDGRTLGTAAYMSPEQMLGQQADHRTDIWSLGVVLYEMLTGKLPFRGDYDPALMYAIAHEEPEPITAVKPEVPLEAEQVVGKALIKNADKRYQSAAEMKQDLEELRESLHLLPKRSRLQLKLIRRRKQIAIGVAVVVMAIVLTAFGIRFFSDGARPIDWIAVLPLDNLSGDPDQEHFADGMTRELTAALGQIGAWNVISSRSAMLYKDTKKTLPEIAAELGVGAIVEGSVLHVGDSVRITVQLIEAAMDRQLWADSYDREERNILALHSEVAQAIAREIQVTLTPQEQARLASVPPVNPEAYNLYLLGRYHFTKYSKEGTEKAIEYFQQAIEIDSNYAQAHAGLADGYMSLWYFSDMPLEEARSRMDPPLQKALEIDDKLPEGHFVVASIKYYFDWDWAGAEIGYKRAIALDPNFVDAQFEYAWFLMAMGRSEEAITQAKRALQLDPVSYIVNFALAAMYTYSRQYDQAIEQFQQTIELKPNDSSPHWWLAGVYEKMGRYEDAVRARQKSWILRGLPPEKVAAWVAELDSAYSESGPKGYWTWLLARLDGKYDRYPLATAEYYAQLGDNDQAFVWLEKAYEKHDAWIRYLNVNPSWDPLRDDPRFQDLLRRMNFPENEARE